MRGFRVYWRKHTVLRLSLSTGELHVNLNVNNNLTRLPTGSVAAKQDGFYIAIRYTWKRAMERSFVSEFQVRNSDNVHVEAKATWRLPVREFPFAPLRKAFPDTGLCKSLRLHIFYYYFF